MTKDYVYYVVSEYLVSTHRGIQRFCLLYGLFEQSPTQVHKLVYSPVIALSDILTGGVLFPLLLIEHSSMVTSYLTNIILFSGVCNLCSVTYVRYIAIMKPLKSQYLVPKMFKKAVILSWLIPIILSLLPLFWNSNSKLKIHKVYIICLQLFAFVVPYVFIVFAYVRIFQEVRRSFSVQKDIRVETPRERTNEKRSLSREIKVAKIFGIISATFFFCWLPIIYIKTADTVFSRWDIIPDFMPTVSLFTVAINSLVNPIIYACLKPDFKTAVHIFLRSPFRGQDRRNHRLEQIDMLNIVNPRSLNSDPFVICTHYRAIPPDSQL